MIVKMVFCKIKKLTVIYQDLMKKVIDKLLVSFVRKDYVGKDQVGVIVNVINVVKVVRKLIIVVEVVEVIVKSQVQIVVKVNYQLNYSVHELIIHLVEDVNFILIKKLLLQKELIFILKVV